jgi:AbiV family abortive infection protein
MKRRNGIQEFRQSNFSCVRRKRLEISEQLWNELKKNTLAGIIRLLEAADILLSSNGDVSISAGLYTYAIEEYGKLNLLSECIPENGKVKIKNQLFYGRESHDLKFKAALNKLPDECKYIGVDYWAGYFPKGFWGGWFPDERSVVAGFKSRLAIFYCDLDDSKKTIKPVPLVGKKSLETAIEKFKTIALAYSLT